MKEAKIRLSTEEKWNVRTHFLGVIFGLLAFPVLWISLPRNLEAYRYLGIAVYTISFLFLFSSSTIYHYSVEPKRKFLWRKLDHISIYFMISGSYVPYMLQYIEKSTAFLFLAIMYSIVIAGSVLKIWFTGRYDRASVLLYIFLGWMILFLIKPFYLSASALVMTLVILGGVAYMIGVYFYSKDHRKFYHAIWHCFVLLGSIFHFLGVYLV